MGTMDIWYAHMSEEDLRGGLTSTLHGKVEAKELKRGERNIEKARTRDSLDALTKLAELVDGQYRIVSQPPLVVPARDLAGSLRAVRRGRRADDPRAVP